MKQRLLAALGGLAITLPLIVWGGVLGVAALVAVALLIALDEYATMATAPADGGAPDRRARSRARFLLVLGGGAVHAAFAWGPGWTFPASAFALILALSWPMFAEGDVKRAADQAIRLGFGMFYAPVLVAALVWVRREPDGLALLFFLMACTWLGDTGAYFAGRFAGRTPLFSRVSPKKTWEGFWGGVALALAGGLVVKAIALPERGWLEVAVLAVGLDVAGVVGDLAESMLKRAWGVKDSGWIMPGHGGILDRIDSLLFSGAALWTWLVASSML